MSNNNNKQSRRAARRANRRGGGNPGLSNDMALTGGTMDVKPELLSFLVSESAADTTTSLTVALPVLRNFAPAGGQRAQIVEILKVFAVWSSMAEVDSTATLLIGTKSKGTTTGTAADPDVFAVFAKQIAITTSGTYAISRVECFDCTDGNGNGILVATDNIYAQISSASTGASVSASVKVLYRIYGASVMEYVGIVQGQQ